MTTTMASSPAALELLTTELFDQVLGYLSPQQTARLGQCSKSLWRRIEPGLFNVGNNRHLAMKWACKQGMISVIDRCISYGSSVSVVLIPDKQRCATSSVDATLALVPVKTLTLHLAARHTQIDAFRHLIQLGARIDEPEIDPHTLRGLVDCLCDSANAAVLESFLRAGLASQLSEVLAGKILIHVIANSKSANDTHPVRLLLDGGANPNYIQSRRSKHGSMSPLSAALLAGRLDVMRLLLERNADINVAPDPYPSPLPTLPLHVPVCAAVELLLQNGTGSMQTCLDHGANLDIRVPITQGPKSRFMTLTTPALMYLEGVQDWEGEHGDIALERLQYLLDHGARVTPIREQPNEQTLRRVSYRYRPVPSSFRLLVRQQSLYRLTNAPLVSAVKLVVQHGALEDQTGKILASFDHFPATPQTGFDLTILNAWDDILNTLLESPRYHEDLNVLLYEFILGKGTSPLTCKCGGHSSTIGAFARITVTRIIAAGADINWREDEYHPTVLHQLCWLYSKFRRSLLDNDDWKLRTLTPERVQFLRFLVEKCGADPNSEWEGRTPTEMMRLCLERQSERELPLAEELLLILGDRN